MSNIAENSQGQPPYLFNQKLGIFVISNMIMSLGFLTYLFDTWTPELNPIT